MFKRLVLGPITIKSSQIVPTLFWAFQDVMSVVLEAAANSRTEALIALLSFFGSESQPLPIHAVNSRIRSFLSCSRFFFPKATTIILSSFGQRHDTEVIDGAVAATLGTAAPKFVEVNFIHFKWPPKSSFFSFELLCSDSLAVLRAQRCPPLPRHPPTGSRAASQRGSFLGGGHVRCNPRIPRRGAVRVGKWAEWLFHNSPLSALFHRPLPGLSH